MIKLHGPRLDFNVTIDADFIVALGILAIVLISILGK